MAGLLLLALFAQGFGQAITPTTNGTGISADDFATGTWRTLNDIVIQETAPGQLQAGNIRFQVPSGFVWDTGGAVPIITVTQSKSQQITVTLSSRSSTEIVFSLSGTSAGTPPNNPHTIEFDGFRIRPAQGTPLTSGQIRNAGSSAPGGTTNYGSISMVAGADNRVRVETQPNSSGALVSARNVVAGNSITAYSNVRDQFNNFKRNESATWSLQNITGGVVSGNLSASGASATLTGNLVGSANIRATIGALNIVQSGTITVIPANATTIVIATQPSSTATAGTAFATQPVIRIQDDFTNVITNDNLTQITASRNSGNGTLQGTKTVTVSNGIATFTNLNHQVANTIDLSFSTSGFSSVTSNSITVNTAAAHSLTFTVQPSNVSKNTALSPPVEVQILDQFGNYVSQSGTTVNLSINSGDGTISGNSADTDATGTAVFSTLSFNRVGTKNIVASATGLTNSEVSDDFTVADAGTLAGFKVEVSGGGAIGTQTAGSAFDISITAVDGAGDILDGNQGRDNFTGNVDLTTNSQFSGTTTTTSVGPFVDGVYSPHSIELIESGSSITITATNSSGSESGSSNSFTVNPAAANPGNSTISVSESTLIADGSSQSVITVQLIDQFGNNLITGGDTVVLSNSSTGTLSPVTDNNDGTYTATLTAPNEVGSTTISATVNSSSITSGNPQVTFTFGTLSIFLVEAAGGGSIGTQTAGTAFNLRITAQDDYNNTVTTFTGTVQITSSGTLTNGGGTTASFSSGVLSSHSVNFSSIGSTTITARRTASTESGTSNSFTINPGPVDPTKSTITSSKSFLQNSGADQATIIVQLKDQFNNNLNTGGNAVTLSVSGSSSLGPVTNNGNGTHTSTLTSGTVIQTATITGTVDSQNITDDVSIVITQFNNWAPPSGGNPSGRSDWGTAGNWSLGTLPTTNQIIIIPAGLSSYPIIDGEDPVIDFMQIQLGATATLSGRTLTINNEISGGGSFSGNTGTVNLGGNSKISNFISGSSTINMNGSSAQVIEGDFTANVLNIQNDVSSSDYVEAFTSIVIETGNTLTMNSGSDLVAYADITVNGTLVGNGSRFRLGGNINGSNFSLTNTSVTLDGSAEQQINGIQNIKSFTIDNTAGVVVNNDLTVTDTLFITNGTLTISSGNSFVSNVKEGNTSNIIAQREISGSRGWRLISPPLSSTYGDFLDGTTTQGYIGSTLGNASVDSLQPNVLYYLESYSGTDNQRWRAPGNATDNLTAGRGLFVFFFGDVSGDTRYTNALPNTLEIQGAEYDGNGTEFTFPVTYTANADTGWNMVGNPFAATVDWDDGNWTKTNMDNVLYVWDPVSGDYLDWNGISGSLGDGKIKPFQGFWVKANGGGTPSLKVNKSSKTTGGAFYKSTKEEEIAIKLTLKAAGLEKETHLTFSEQGKNAKDRWDAYRLLPLDTQSYLELYTMLRDGTEIAINSLPRKFGIPIEIPLHVGGFIEGIPIVDNLELSWSGVKNIPESWKIELIDNEAQNKSSQNGIDLTEVDQISLDLPSDSTAKPISNSIENFKLVSNKSHAKSRTSRFTLRIDPGEDAADLPKKFELFNNYPNPFNPTTRIKFAVPIEGNVSLTVFDILGRKVSELTNTNYRAGFHEVNWDASRVASGIYIYRLATQNGVFTKKMTLIK